MALSRRPPGGRSRPSRHPEPSGGGVEGVPSVQAEGGERPRPRRRPVRRPANRGGSGSGVPPFLIRIGIIVVLLLIGGVVKLATAKPAGDVRYFNALADLTENIHRNPFANVGTIRQKINNLPVRDVTDPMLREMHSLLVQFMDLLEQADGTPDLEARLRNLGQRIDNQIDRLNAKYAR